MYKTLAAGTSILDQTATDDQPVTIIRTRGMLNVISDTVVASEQPFGAFGLAVVSDQAVAIGVTAIPTPYTDADSDLWFVHGYFAAPTAFGTSVGFANVSMNVEFDSKAMRRMSQDETVVVVIENGSGAAGALFTFNFALLVKVG